MSVPRRTLIAMSGGVDSSVAAARLRDRGDEVVGVTLHLWDYPPAPTRPKSRCCAPEDVHDAQRVAAHLGIPHYTFDRRELFTGHVVEPFVDSYLRGRTPSPCVWCNRWVKMRQLLALADQLGAARVATGHYARIQPDAAGVARLHRARDERKDQSYFLFMLRADELARIELPLGDSLKQQVRAEAVRLELPGARKGESQELCFVSSPSYAEFVEQRAGDRVAPGQVVDEQGHPLGTHGGIHRFTVGQRRGLGVALGHPAFVVALDADRRRVVVGAAEQLLARVAWLSAGDWSDDVRFPVRATVRVRSQHEGAPARIVRAVGGDGQALRVEFDQPVRAVCPGQVAVAYDGQRVLGGATILRTAIAGTAEQEE